MRVPPGVHPPALPVREPAPASPRLGEDCASPSESGFTGLAGFSGFRRPVSRLSMRPQTPPRGMGMSARRSERRAPVASFNPANPDSGKPAPAIPAMGIRSRRAPLRAGRPRSHSHASPTAALRRTPRVFGRQARDGTGHPENRDVVINGANAIQSWRTSSSDTRQHPDARTSMGPTPFSVGDGTHP